MSIKGRETVTVYIRVCGVSSVTFRLSLVCSFIVMNIR